MAHTLEQLGSYPAVETVDLVKTFGDTEVLHGVNLAISPGELTLIRGESGSGKTTLLSCMAGQDTVTSGEVWYGDQEVTGLSARGLERWRKLGHVGLVFQESCLINELDVADNIVMSHEVAGISLDYDYIMRLYTALGLADKLLRYPDQLSGGEKQRVAIARALAPKPEILFADEPSASLDEAGKHRIHKILRGVLRIGTTVVLVSHDEIAVNYADRAVTLADGQIVRDIHAFPL